MKKIPIAILMVFLILACVILFFLDRKINVMQATCDALFTKIDERFSATETLEGVKPSSSKPLEFGDAETFLQNIVILKEHFGEESDRPTEIANHCLNLSKNGKIDSSKIVRVNEHTAPRNAYCVEIFTEDGQQYWFTFKTGTRLLYTIHKGKDQEVLLYINVLAQGDKGTVLLSPTPIPI